MTAPNIYCPLSGPHYHPSTALSRFKMLLVVSSDLICIGIYIDNTHPFLLSNFAIRQSQLELTRRSALLQLRNNHTHNTDAESVRDVTCQFVVSTIEILATFLATANELHSNPWFSNWNLMLSSVYIVQIYRHLGSVNIVFSLLWMLTTQSKMVVCSIDGHMVQ
jgi:hypothetical protein